VIISISGQEDTSNSLRHLYRPQNYNLEEIANSDTNKVNEQSDNVSDSIRAKHIQDSLYARQIFIRDSLLKRQLFVQDSILKRKRMIDSLQYLQKKLPVLLEAGLWLNSEQIITDFGKIEIIGDSVLNNFPYVILPFSFNQPYTPWISSVPLGPGSIKIDYKAPQGKISLLKTSRQNLSFEYPQAANLLIINEPGIVVTKTGKKFYKVPFDSVFFNEKGKIAKIKRYAHFHSANDSYQKGNFLFTHLYEVKQFDYNQDNTLKYYEVVSFCDRWIGTEASKVCTIVKYTVSKVGNSFNITRQNNPANNYSDGKFVYEFDNIHNLKFVTFNSVNNSDNWKTVIELNEKGHVSRYIYYVKEKVNNTLIFNYYLDDPKAKNKVEAISCTFEDDGISYYQKNITTGKSRVRDHFTGEWEPWQ